MLLLREEVFQRGQYQVRVDLNGGTAELQQSIDGLPFVALPDGVFAADFNQRMFIAESKLKPVLTGAAVISINFIYHNLN